MGVTGYDRLEQGADLEMELLILMVLSALVGLGCLGGAAWAVFGGEEVGVGRIFILLVGLMFAALFLGMAAWVARQGPLKNLGKKSGGETEAKPKETTPASS
jgi:hypothetical protein